MMYDNEGVRAVHSMQSRSNLNFVTEVTAVPRDIGGRSYDTGGENHDFEPVTVPRRTLHSPSQFVVPLEVEEEVLLDSIKEIRKDGPVPSGISLREHTTPPDGRLYSIRFDSIGKPVDPHAGKFSARCCVYARMGHLFPLDVMWKNQSEASKDMALKELSASVSDRGNTKNLSKITIGGLFLRCSLILGCWSYVWFDFWTRSCKPLAAIQVFFM